MIIKILNLIFFTRFFFISCAQNSNDQIPFEQQAKQRVQEVLKDTSYKPFYDILIKDKETAIAVAEPILFSVYGKNQIISERPYEVFLTNGHWYMIGTLPKGYKGGTFEIIISAKNGGVIRLIHY